METKPYIVLLSLAGPPSKTLASTLDQLGNGSSKALLITPSCVVMGIDWARAAHELWDALFKARCMTNVKELVIVEAGTDWCAGRDKPASGWLVRHLGDPGHWKHLSDLG